MATLTLSDMRFETYTSKTALQITSGGTYTLDNCFFDKTGAYEIELSAAVTTPTTIALQNGTSSLIAGDVNNLGSSTFTIQNNVTFTVHVEDNAGANLQNANVYVQAADGTGPLPYEDSVTITRSGTTATVAHTAHGMNTGEYVKLRGITDKTEDNSGAQQITVTGTNAYTFVTTDAGSTSYTGTITSTGVLLYGLTDASGNISITRTFGPDQPVSGNVRKASASPHFRTVEIDGESVDSTNGLTINARMILDG